MVRTRSNYSGVRVGNKASFKAPSASRSPASSGKSTRKCSGSGNKYCPRETPTWQKEITHFFNVNENTSTPKVEEPKPGTSSSTSD